ncbi:MAG: hypothetical protein ACLFST_02835 [Spirochaetia bacterium]
MVFWIFLGFLLFTGCTGENPQDDAPTTMAVSAGEAPEDTALLISGPERKKGIPYIGPNALEYFSAVYVIQDREIQVLYIPDGFVFNESWTPAGCRLANISVYSISDTVLLTRNSDGFVLFVTAASGASEPFDICRFIQYFHPRFQYFQSTLGSSRDAHFPAVIRLR